MDDGEGERGERVVGRGRTGEAVQAEMAALETLEGLVLESILSKLGPRSVAVVACVSNRLRSFAADETLWRAFCSQDLDLSAPVDPDGNRCASFKVLALSSPLPPTL